VNAAVDTALAVLACRWPAAAARAMQALATLAPPALPVRGWSPLTADGCPVELAFSSVPAGVRYTAAIQAPDADPAAALAIAEQRLAALGGGAMPAWLAARCRAAQRGGHLAYGAWLGGGHAAAGDRYKLYAEVPAPSAAAGADAAVAVVRDLVGAEGVYGRHALRMIGHDPAAGITELYFRARRLGRDDLATLAAEGGHDPAAVVARIDALAGAPSLTGDALAGTWGFSVAVAATGQRVAITLFTFARTLIGDDAAVRRRLAALAPRYGWDLADHAAVTAPMARPGVAAHHGMVALVLRAGAPIELRIGTSPPRVTTETPS
jgi:hypothetical protein